MGRKFFKIFAIPMMIFMISIPELSGTDFSMVEGMISWVDSLKSTDDPDLQKKIFFQKVASTPGAEAIEKYWSEICGPQSPGLYRFFYDLIKGNDSRNPGDCLFMTREWYLRSGRLFGNFYKKPEVYNKIMENLKQAGIKEMAGALAAEFLPDNNLDDVKVVFAVFGHSMAFSVNNVCVYDLLQTPVDRKGNIMTAEIVRSLGHEIHHIGFDRVSCRKMDKISNKEKLSLIWLLASEGIPTFYIDKPFLNLKEYRKRKDILYRAIARDWKEHCENLRDLYIEAESDIGHGLLGELSHSAINWKWNEGVKGAVYVLGSDMISVIDQYLGKEAVMEVISDYRKLIVTYNHAAGIGNISGKNHYIFKTGIEKAVSEFSE